MVRVVDLAFVVDAQTIAGAQQRAAHEAAVEWRLGNRAETVSFLAVILIDALLGQLVVTGNRRRGQAHRLRDAVVDSLLHRRNGNTFSVVFSVYSPKTLT